MSKPFKIVVIMITLILSLGIIWGGYNLYMFTHFTFVEGEPIDADADVTYYMKAK